MLFFGFYFGDDGFSDGNDLFFNYDPCGPR
jgi:hypothetical protein